MSTEDFERSLAQGQERFHQDQLGEEFPEPVDHARKREKVQHAQRTDLPFVQRQAERFLRQVRTKPIMAHPQKEEANGPTQRKDIGGKLAQWVLMLRGLGSK